MYGVWSPGSNFHALNSFQCYSKLNLYIFIFPNFLHAPWPFPCISLFISLFPVLNCRRWVHKEYSTLYTSISYSWRCHGQQHQETEQEDIKVAIGTLVFSTLMWDNGQPQGGGWGAEETGGVYIFSIFWQGEYNFGKIWIKEGNKSKKDERGVGQLQLSREPREGMF